MTFFFIFFPCVLWTERCGILQIQCRFNFFWLDTPRTTPIKMSWHQSSTVAKLIPWKKIKQMNKDSDVNRGVAWWHTPSGPGTPLKPTCDGLGINAHSGKLIHVKLINSFAIEKTHKTVLGRQWHNVCCFITGSVTYCATVLCHILNVYTTFKKNVCENYAICSDHQLEAFLQIQPF